MYFIFVAAVAAAAAAATAAICPDLFNKPLHHFPFFTMSTSFNFLSVTNIFFILSSPLSLPFALQLYYFARIFHLLFLNTKINIQQLLHGTDRVHLLAHREQKIINFHLLST